MADPNLLALQVQPAASIGPTVNALAQLNQTRAQTALTTAEGNRQNLLYSAIQSGDPNAIARAGSPDIAKGMVDFTQRQRALDAWSKYGASAAGGDQRALDAIAAADPQAADSISSVREHVVGAIKTGDDNTRAWYATHAENTAPLGSSMLTVAGESDPRRQADMLPGLRAAAARAGVTPDQVDQWVGMLSTPSGRDEWASMGKGLLATGSAAQSALAEVGFKPQTIDTEKSTVVPGVAAAAQGAVPLKGPSADATAATAPVQAPAAAGVGAVPLPAGVPPGASPSSPEEAPTAVGGGAGQNPTPQPQTPASAPALDPRLASLAQIPPDPRLSSLNIPALPPAGQQEPVGTPQSAAAIPAVPPVAPPVPSPGPEMIGNVPLQRNPTGNGYTTQGSPGLSAALKSQGEELYDAGSVQNRTANLSAQEQISSMIQAAESPGFVSGANAQLYTDLSKQIQSWKAATGNNDPALDGFITNQESFAKNALAFASAIAKTDVGARVTNFDLSTFLKSNASPDVSVGGNLRILGVADQIVQRNIALTDVARNANGRYKAFSDGAAQYDRDHPIVNPQTGQVLTTANTHVHTGAYAQLSADPQEAVDQLNSWHLQPGAIVRNSDGTRVTVTPKMVANIRHLGGSGG